MGRMVDVEQLVSAANIAARLGFKRVQHVHYYFRSDPDFPDPVFTVADHQRPLRLWLWPEVEAWWAGRQARNRPSPPPPTER